MLCGDSCHRNRPNTFDPISPRSCKDVQSLKHGVTQVSAELSSHRIVLDLELPHAHREITLDDDVEGL